MHRRRRPWIRASWRSSCCGGLVQAELGAFVRLFFNVEVLKGYGDAFLRGRARPSSWLSGRDRRHHPRTRDGDACVRPPASCGPRPVYINFFRGTPLIWQLLTLLRLALGLNLAGRLPSGDHRLRLNTGAYAAEVFRAGIQSIEKGQMEAARSLGMSYIQAMRYR